MSHKVKATVVLEFEDGHKEAVIVDDLQVLGSWAGNGAGQGRPIYEVVHPQVNGVYQHHNVGVALLDLLRVAIIDLNPEWCKTGPGNLPKLSKPTIPTFTKDIGVEAGNLAKQVAGGNDHGSAELDKILKDANA